MTKEAEFHRLNIGGYWLGGYNGTTGEDGTTDVTIPVKYGFSIFPPATPDMLSKNAMTGVGQVGSKDYLIEFYNGVRLQLNNMEPTDKIKFSDGECTLNSVTSGVCSGSNTMNKINAWALF